MSPTATVRYCVTGSAAIDGEKLPSSAIAARAAAKNARHIGISLVGDWRMVGQSPNLRSIFSRRQSLVIWIYYLEIRENEIEPDQRSAGLRRRGRKDQPDKRRASAWPIAALRQPLPGGDW